MIQPRPAPVRSMMQADAMSPSSAQAMRGSTMRRIRRFAVASVSAVGSLTVTAQAAFGHGSGLHVGFSPGSAAVEIDLPFAALLVVGAAGAGLAARHEIRRRRSRTQRSKPTVGRSRAIQRSRLATAMAVVLSAVLVAPIGANDQPPPSAVPEPSPTGGKAGVTGLAGGPASILIYGPTSGGYADTTPGMTSRSGAQRHGRRSRPRTSPPSTRSSSPTYRSASPIRTSWEPRGSQPPGLVGGVTAT